MELTRTEKDILRYIASHECVSSRELHEFYEQLKQQRNVTLEMFYGGYTRLRWEGFITRNGNMICINNRYITNIEEILSPPPESAKKKKVIA